jgi:26S proteasome regulatory subunit N5
MQIFSIIKRHGQFKKTVQKLIQECISYIKQTPDISSRISFIDTLLTVSEGKIYLELERARLTMQKCQIFEYEKKDLRKAVEIVQDLQVETFNSVKQREKTKYIIEQIRLFLSIQDPGFFLRAKIRIN